MATARCTWTAVSGVDGYNVYLKSNGTFVKQNSELITDTVYDIENLEDGNYEAYATALIGAVESDPSNIDAFIIDSGFLSTNFSEYTNNDFPSDWIDDNNADDWEVQDEIFTSINNANNGFASWNKISSENHIVEGKLRVSSTASGTRVRLFLRVDDGTGFTGTSRNLVYIELRDGNNSRYAIILNGSFNSRGSQSFSYSANTWYRFKSEIITDGGGFDVKWKIWEDGTSEPESWWTGSRTSSGGLNYVGRVGFGGHDAVVECDFLEVELLE